MGRGRKAKRGQRDMSLAVQPWDFEVGDPEHGMRLDEFLSSRVRFRSRSNLRRAIEQGRVTIRPFKDPQRAEIGRIRPGLKLRVGQEVLLHVPAPHCNPDAVEPEAVAIPVVHEDEALLVVNKPPQMSVYPTRRHLAGSLLQRLHQRHRELGGDATGLPMLCHRLDRETTGLVVLAKDRDLRRSVGEQLESRRVAKVYLALVSGSVEGESGLIDLALGEDPASSLGIKSAPRADGSPAETEWLVRKRLESTTLLELRPRTGRQHQLRVHCAAIGHPIVGDKLYTADDQLFVRWLAGELESADRELLQLEHHALHAWKLAFEDPGSGDLRSFEAPLWPDVAELVGSWPRA